jgi:hypothetical protein
MTQFKVGDLVIPKQPHSWNYIVCKVTKIDEQGLLVDNGRGEARYFTAEAIEHLCDVIHRHLLEEVHVNPEFAKKTIFVVAPTSDAEQ